VFHLFVILRRGAACAAFGSAASAPHPLPCARHVQPPFARFARGPLPETERIAREVLSLPLYPELAERDLDYVAEQVLAFVGS
jgi:dTDP-4-amino-4,6-dideoxygalactose transaminase